MKIFPSALLAMLYFSTTAQAAQADPSQPSRLPTAEQIRAATMPGYRPEPSGTEECLGRLVWSALVTLEWPLRYNAALYQKFTHRFSEHVVSKGDEIRFGNTRISVTALTPAARDEVLASLPDNRHSAWQKKLAQREAELKRATKRKNGTEKERNAYEIAKDEVAEAKKALDELAQGYKPYRPELADSRGYWSSEEAAAGNGDRYSIYRAYLFRQDYLYSFESKALLGPAMTAETHGRQFSALLASFRQRKMNEIPSEPGVCIPYGFLPDNGQTVIDIKQSIRWVDAPGVLYTIHTGTVQPQQLKATLALATATAQVGRFGSEEEEQVKPYVVQRIGPRQVAMGGLRGEQGGVVLKVEQAGQAPYQAYSVFTGYAGWFGVDALPFILVDLQTFNCMQAPELKVNPPDFKQSMQRLDNLLKNMRVRSATPKQ